MLLFFPETSQRNTAGDRGRGIVYRSLWSLLRDSHPHGPGQGVQGGKKRRARRWGSRDKEGDAAPIILSYVDEQLSRQQSHDARATQIPGKTRKGLRLPNPLACLRILLHSKGSLTVVAINAVNSAVKAAMQASLGAQCVKIYGLTYLQAGLIYIPSGLGGSVGAYAAGRWVDWNYHRWQDSIMRRMSMVGDEAGKREPPTAADFPLEKIRLRGLHFLSLVTVLGLVGYGVALEVRAVCSFLCPLFLGNNFTWRYMLN